MELNQFTGYLKCGKWRYYNADGKLKTERDFDLESLENRKIKEY